MFNSSRYFKNIQQFDLNEENFDNFNKYFGFSDPTSISFQNKITSGNVPYVSVTNNKRNENRNLIVVLSHLK